jgi:hypothetical protein
MVSGSPLQGGTKGATGGFILGGPAGAMAGAAIGLGSNLTTKAIESITGNRYIPKNVQFRNELNEYMDQMKYWKAQYDLQTTGNPSAYNDMHETMIGAETRSQLFKAMPSPEKSYLSDFLNEQDPDERKRIYSTVPKYLKPLLAREWNMPRNKVESYIPAMPNADWSGWDESIPVNHIKASLVRNEGYNLHDFGLGYGYDKLQMTDDYLGDLSNVSAIEGNVRMSESTILDTVRKIVGGSGHVSTSGRGTDIIEIIIT